MIHTKPLQILGSVLILSMLTACAKKDDQSATEEAAEPSNPAATQQTEAPEMSEMNSNAEVVEIVPGLEMKMLRAGSGAVATAGEVVEVHYTGWNYDPTAADGRGSKFDSSVDRGDRFQFPLGGGRVIKGWDLGVEGMQVGEVRELKIAPDLAYGERGAGGVIAPGATLIFEVEYFGSAGN